MDNEEIQNLITDSKSGNTRSFGVLVSEFQSLIFSLAFRLLCNEEDARDIVQDTFVKAWKNLSKYNKQYAFTTWLYKIATNLCYDKLRVIKQSQEIPLDIPSEENIEVNFINEDLKNLIMTLVDQLTPKQKLVFILRDIEELSVEEVQEITGLSAEKIKSNLYLARQQLKNKLNNHGIQ
jgi:RNA polymerase sigma factor, sigma-70 family